VIWYCGKKNIMKRRTLHRGLEKLLMTENNFLFFDRAEEAVFKKVTFFYRFVGQYATAPKTIGLSNGRSLRSEILSKRIFTG